MSESSGLAAGQGEHPKIILFHYYYSPYAHKVSWYLNLRGIKYQECLQPPILPRPDISALGIKYRRIPLLSIGNDVYCDTYLILRELERRFPKGGLDIDPQNSKQFEERSNKLFPYAAGCIPSDLPLMKDEKFVKDRAEYSGKSYKKEDVDAARPRALNGVREGFGYMETEVLADDRKWILGDDLSLADIEAIWPLEWVVNLRGALAGSDITATTFPKTFAYISRFNALLPRPKAVSVAVPKIKGPEAKEIILSYNDQKSLGSSATGNIGVLGDGLSGVMFGEEMEITPVDTGKEHPQRGRIRELSKEIAVLEVVPMGECNGKRALRLHFPRKGYTIKGLGAGGNARL